MVDTKKIEQLQKYPNHYIKVPRELVSAKDCGGKRISCFSFLVMNSTLENAVSYSCNFLIEWCGFAPSRKKYKTDGLSMNQKFQMSMKWFQINNYIYDFNEPDWYGNHFQHSIINEEKIFPQNNFGIIYDFEFYMIKNYKSKYKLLNTGTLLLVLSYIRLNIWQRTNLNVEESKTMKQEKPEILNKQYIKIEEDIGVSSKIISKSVNTLCDLGIIAIHTMPRFKDKSGNWHTPETIFVNKYRYRRGNNSFFNLDSNYNYQEEIDNGISFVRNRKYSSKKFYQD